MDAVFFSVKRAFHATLKYGRQVLGPSGLTPARFDVLMALTERRNDRLGPIPNTQTWLRKMLGVARSSICEMLAELERLGWIERTRDLRDHRTLRVELTRKGRELVEEAYARALGSGDVPVAIDVAMGDGSFEDGDVFEARDSFETITGRLRRHFGDTAMAHLYPWHPDDIGGMFEVTGPSDVLLACEPPHEPVELPLLEQPL